MLQMNLFFLRISNKALTLHQKPAFLNIATNCVSRVRVYVYARDTIYIALCYGIVGVDTKFNA